MRAEVRAAGTMDGQGLNKGRVPAYFVFTSTRIDFLLPLDFSEFLCAARISDPFNGAVAP